MDRRWVAGGRVVGWGGGGGEGGGRAGAAEVDSATRTAPSVFRHIKESRKSLARRKPRRDSDALHSHPHLGMTHLNSLEL